MQPKFLMTFAAALAVAVLGLSAGRTAEAAEEFAVSYRLPQWKTLHFHDDAKAESHYQAVKNLGCEVKKDGHAGHVDVSYRCPQWKQITLKTDDLAHQWEAWLKASGFETQHAH
jgi:hypothetical protein